MCARCGSTTPIKITNRVVSWLWTSSLITLTFTNVLKSLPSLPPSFPPSLLLSLPLFFQYSSCHTSSISFYPPPTPSLAVSPNCLSREVLVTREPQMKPCLDVWKSFLLPFLLPFFSLSILLLPCFPSHVISPFFYVPLPSPVYFLSYRLLSSPLLSSLLSSSLFSFPLSPLLPSCLTEEWLLVITAKEPGPRNQIRERERERET